jgi:hypothetical protein
MDFEFNLNDEEFSKCKIFADESARTQRENRSGGTYVRSIDQISQDTMRGKVAEVAIKNFLEKNPLNVNNLELDFGVYGRGTWDDADIIINNNKISIKSAKWFSKWLLLETKDIDRGDIYDYYILVLVNRDLKSGIIKGFASKEEILNDINTYKLSKGDFIPGTGVPLDASNHARKMDFLHNSKEDWIDFIRNINN